MLAVPRGFDSFYRLMRRSIDSDWRQPGQSQDGQSYLFRRWMVWSCLTRRQRICHWFL